MKNKLLILLLALLLTFTVGCEKKEETKEEQNAVETAEKVEIEEEKAKEETEEKQEDKKEESKEENKTKEENVKNPSAQQTQTNQQSTQTNQKPQQAAPVQQQTPTQTAPAAPETPTVPKCTAKKFNNKYSYVYNTFEECKKQGNNAFFDVVDNVDTSVFVYGCDTIVDECGDTYYGVYFMAYSEEKGEYKFYY